MESINQALQLARKHSSTAAYIFRLQTILERSAPLPISVSLAHDAGELAEGFKEGGGGVVVAEVELTDEPSAERQPILLTAAADNPNSADALFLIDGADPGPLDAYSRCILLFDGRDEAALQIARQRWKGFKAEGLSVSYWRQGAERGWEKQA